MDNSNKDLHFNLMSFEYKIRDFFNPPVKILKKLGIGPGQYVLDFGCGPGSFSFAASKLVGSIGKVYSLDINTLAINKLKKVAVKNKLSNLETILSDCKTGLSQNSIDLILLFDVYHELDSKIEILEELYIALKPEGILAISDHHLKGEEIVSEITKFGLFKLYKENNKIFLFLKEIPPDRVLL